MIRQYAPRAKDFTNRRYRHRVVVDLVERAKNRTKSKERARVEHSIGVVKPVFGFAKVRYRGLYRNAHRLLVTCALANRFIARRHLLRGQPVWCACTRPKAVPTRRTTRKTVTPSHPGAGRRPLDRSDLGTTRLFTGSLGMSGKRYAVR